jgi:hypothetical protein
MMMSGKNHQWLIPLLTGEKKLKQLPQRSASLSPWRLPPD